MKHDAELDGGTRRHLEAFMVDPSTPAPPLDVLRRARVSTYAYGNVAAEDPMHAGLREDSARATRRHMALRHEVSRLVAAWADQGIGALMFKGFYLAEFVYPMPGQRMYADVDVMIDPSHASAASRVARQLGWRESWSAERTSTMLADASQSRPEDYPGHEVLNLDLVELGLRLDVHRRIVHNRLPWTRVQDRITRQAWEASRPVRWGGADVRTLRPEDSILIGLVMNRCWGSDDWNIKPGDYADFAAIVTKFRVTRDGLFERARELRCVRTLEIYLARCDPFRRVLDLRPPEGIDRFARGCVVIPERGHPGLEHAVHRMLERPREVAHLARALPSVLRALRRTDCSNGTAGGTARDRERRGQAVLLSYREWQGVQQAIRRALKLVGRDPDRPDGLYERALWHALRSHGLDATLRGRDLELDGKRVPIRAFDVGGKRGGRASAMTGRRRDHERNA